MIRLIRFIARESPSVFYAALLFSLISALGTMGILTLFFAALGADLTQVTWVAFVAYAIVTVATRSAARTLLAYLTRRTVKQMRVRLARQVAATPLLKFEQIGKAGLTTSFAEDVGKIAAVLPDLVTMFANVAFVSVCLTYLGYVSPYRLIILVAAIVTGVGGYVLFRRHYLHQQTISRNRWDTLNRSFHSILDGLKEIKFDDRRREQVLNDFELDAEALQRAASRQAVYMLSILILTNVLLFVALGLSIFDFEGGVVDARAMTAYGISIIYLAGPVRDLADLLPNISGASISLLQLDRMNLRLESVEATELPSADPITPVSSLEAVALEHHYQATGLSYPFSVGPVNLTLRAGEVLFIAGGNGTGKTTLAKVLTGLYPPSSGELRVNGEPLTLEQSLAYRQQIAAIFSDFELFKQLSAVGDSDFERRTALLLKRLQMEGRVQIHSGRLLTTNALSTGERKRLALMSALLADKKLYLFDEWAADQDPVFREIFYREILMELREAGKMTIVISHDDRYFSLADKLLLLERGERPRMVYPQNALKYVSLSKRV